MRQSGIAEFYLLSIIIIYEHWLCYLTTPQLGYLLLEVEQWPRSRHVAQPEEEELMLLLVVQSCLWLGQWALWQATEQYDTPWHRPHRLRARCWLHPQWPHALGLLLSVDPDDTAAEEEAEAGAVVADTFGCGCFGAACCCFGGGGGGGARLPPPPVVLILAMAARSISRPGCCCVSSMLLSASSIRPVPPMACASFCSSCMAASTGFWLCWGAGGRTVACEGGKTGERPARMKCRATEAGMSSRKSAGRSLHPPTRSTRQADERRVSVSPAGLLRPWTCQHVMNLATGSLTYRPAPHEQAILRPWNHPDSGQSCSLLPAFIILQPGWWSQEACLTLSEPRVSTCRHSSNSSVVTCTHTQTRRTVRMRPPSVGHCWSPPRLITTDHQSVRCVCLSVSPGAACLDDDDGQVPGGHGLGH